MIIFSSTPEWYSKSVLDESLIRLMIVDELNNYNDKCEYNFDEKLMSIGNIKSYGYWKSWYIDNLL